MPRSTRAGRLTLCARQRRVLDRVILQTLAHINLGDPRMLLSC